MSVATAVNIGSDAFARAGFMAAVTARGAVSGREIEAPLKRLDTRCLVCKRTFESVCTVGAGAT
jgi:hypothetical protein